MGLVCLDRVKTISFEVFAVAKGLVVMENHQRPGPLSAKVVALDSSESRILFLSRETRG